MLRQCSMRRAALLEALAAIEAQIARLDQQLRSQQAGSNGRRRIGFYSLTEVQLLYL